MGDNTVMGDNTRRYPWIFVLARSSDQARLWARENGLGLKDYRYIHDVQQLAGMTYFEVARLEGWDFDKPRDYVDRLDSVIRCLQYTPKRLGGDDE